MIANVVWENLKFVTGNPNKVREAGQILGVRLEQAEVAGLHEIQTNDIEELVRHKAETAHARLRCPVLVEDSGLIFSAWNGLPGALVKWFESTVGCAGLIKMLEPFENREAFAVCYVAVHDGENISVAKGAVRGRVADSLRGSGGFGWDVLFIPDGHDRAYAEMTAEEKNAISHRKLAFMELKKLFGSSSEQGR